MQNLLIRILLIANRAFDYILLMFMLLIATLGIYFISDAGCLYGSAQPGVYRQYKPSAEEDNSYNELVNDNSDVKAWLTISGTDIDYPVLQGDDNRYYLTRDVYENYSGSGSIFIDCSCSCDFSDFNTIIYGHHMAHGAMFGDLDKFEDETFFNEHRWGSIYINGKKSDIKFYAFIDSADGYDSDIYSYDIHSVDDKIQYLGYLAEHARHYRDIGVSSDDRIVLLSTCSHRMTNGRYILVGAFREKKSESGKTADENIDVGIWRIRVIRILQVLVVMLSLTLFIIIKKKS